jgi:2'-5' RNA ligase
VESAFEIDAYVCLDLPSTARDRVIAIRRAHRDTFRAALPAEITVAGSSGVGPILPVDNPKAVFAIIDRIAAATPPIDMRFGPAFRFPNTDIFGLSVEDEAPFQRLHAEIAGSGIKFRESPYPFFPHCTLRSRSPVSKKDVSALLSERLDGRHRLDTLSVYGVDQLSVSLLHRTYLSARA